MEPALARAIWHRLEMLHAVTYFSSECRAAPIRLGLAGFWMGYFACRAAPMGPAAPGVVEATFFNFRPDRVRRAIPEAWTIARPADLVVARADAAATALRRLLDHNVADGLVKDVLPSLLEAVDRATAAGRPLFAANRDVPVPDDGMAALWQAATALREHRGDTHVALLTGAGLDGCEVHVLFAACEGTPAEMYQQSRGWSPDDWQDAEERLRTRALLADGRTPTARGRDLRAEIERRTDALAVEAYAGLRQDRAERLLTDLGAAAELVAAAGEIIFPNPMGLPREAQRPLG